MGKRKQPEDMPGWNYGFDDDLEEETQIEDWATFSQNIERLAKEERKEERKRKADQKKQKDLADQQAFVPEEDISEQFQFVDDQIDSNWGYENLSGFEDENLGSQAHRAVNKAKWAQKMSNVTKCYIKSYGAFGEPDPRQSTPHDLNVFGLCSCANKSKALVRCFFMFCKYCLKHRRLLIWLTFQI